MPGMLSHCPKRCSTLIDFLPDVANVEAWHKFRSERCPDTLWDPVRDSILDASLVQLCISSPLLRGDHRLEPVRQELTRRRQVDPKIFPSLHVCKRMTDQRPFRTENFLVGHHRLMQPRYFVLRCSLLRCSRKAFTCFTRPAFPVFRGHS